MSAQDDGWEIETDVDIIDDSVTVKLEIHVDKLEGIGISESVYTKLSNLVIFCEENRGHPTVSLMLVSEGELIEYTTGGLGLHEVTYRIGTDEAVTHEWAEVLPGMLSYRTPYIDDGSGFSGTDDATALVAALVQDNSRFIVRAFSPDYGNVTAIWDTEGLAEVIGECMAAFD